MRKYISSFFGEFFKLTLIAIFIGILIGLYRYMVIFVINLSSTLFSIRDPYPFLILYTLSIAIILILFSFVILTKEPSIRGSGINALAHHFKTKERNIKWYIALPGMFFNSLITFFLGIPLGCEAPSTFMSAMVGYAFDDISRKDNSIDDIKLSMGAGFACAFLSPLGGIFYPFEEQKAKLNVQNILKAIYMSFLAYFISESINDYHLIRIPLNDQFDFNIWPVIFIAITLIVIISLILMKTAKLINKLLIKYEDRWFIKYRFHIVSIISILLLMFFPAVTGTGLGIITKLTKHPAYYLIIIWLIARTILFLLGVYSTASGGAYGTGVTLGGLVGYTAIIIGSTFMDISQTQALIIMTISSCAMFGTMNKAPLTGLGLLITIGHYSNFLNYALIAAIIIFGSYTIMHLTGIYGPVFNKKEKIVQ